MNKALKYGLWGFLFGAIGLYLLKIVPLNGWWDTLTLPLLYPGIRIAYLIGEGPELALSNGDMVLISLFEGILYAFLFVLIRSIAKRTTGA